MDEAERLAREAIAKTLAACTQAGDARKADAYAACFAADGVLELVGERLEGREAIRAWMTAPSVIPPPDAPAPRGTGRRSPAYVSHHLTTCRIDLDTADNARVRTYWLVVTAIGLDHSGYYDDRFVRTGEGWLIAHRRPRTLWTADASLVARAG
jgi:hypothetical protein